MAAVRAHVIEAVHKLHGTAIGIQLAAAKSSRVSRMGQTAIHSASCHESIYEYFVTSLARRDSGIGPLLPTVRMYITSPTTSGDVGHASYIGHS